MIVRIVVFLAALAAATPALAQSQQYDAGGKARVSLYGKNSIAGDVPFKLNSDGTLSATFSGTSADNADAVAAVATGLVATQAFPFLYNGATFDRWRGDTTNGAWVNVKASALPAGAATDASITTTNTDLGPPGATACATDTGSCSLNALAQRLAQRLTTINTTLGAPMQATGGSVALVAGSALVGKVGIDQTAPGTTNAVAVLTPSIAPVNSTAAEACHVLKASAGSLLDLTVTIGTTSGYALVFDATSAPVDGAVTPAWWYPVNSNGTFGGINKRWGNDGPLKFTTGITACFSTTGPFTKTASSSGVALSGQIQ